MPPPEIMSPAGYWPQLHAAIEAGADSVYFGLKHFTARAKVGFSLDELPEVMRTLHARGVKGFVTFNTLVFDHEVKEAARAIGVIARAGADAIIVQDLGILKIARQIAPDLELHASTQMSITDAAGVNLAHSLGADRVTLARELSLAEVRAIKQSTGTELEIFVHGALCVAYSGQCFSSEAWGGRSANRGQCAQACRLPYEMVVDGETAPLGDARYLLSPGDLHALHHVPEMVEIGIAALKIEGRYKDADYVALTTRAYRKAVDEAVAGLRLSAGPKDDLELEQVYSRGLAPHFITGTNHQSVVEGRAPRHRGVKIGRVVRVSPDGVIVDPFDAHRIAPLKPGDGLVFDSASWRSPEEPEEGGRAWQVLPAPGGKLELRFARGAVDTSRVRSGDLIWRTHDPDIDKAVRPYLEPASPVRRQPVHVKVTACEGEPLASEWQVGNTAVTITSAPLDTAANRSLTIGQLKEQFSRLGNTPYELAGLEAEIQGQPFAPVSLLNQVRREAVEALSAAQSQPRTVRVNAATLEPPQPGRSASGTYLHLLVRAPQQLDAAVAFRPSSITLDYLDLYGLRPSVERIRTAGIACRVASPRVFKHGEDGILNFLRKLDCPLLVRAAGIVEPLRTSGVSLTGDFSLNAANVYTADLLLGLGLDRITPTHDLNAAQIADLARALGGERIEAIAYGHLPVFHTEHCVFCRFLSSGTTYRDCGRPCEHHRVAVRDTSGREHPVMADAGCRNTVFGAEAQEASLHLEAWLEAGVGHFRLEFVHESAAEVERVATAFRDRLEGRSNTQQLNRKLRQAAPQGTTQGSLFIPASHLTLPVLQ